MKLFEYQTTLPYSIEDVFALTVDLQNAPHWHSIFTNVEQLTSRPIGLGSRWKASFPVGSFMLEIVDYQPPQRVAFQGSSIMGVVPNFTIELQAADEGTLVHYYLHPDVPALMEPLVSLVATAVGRRDLDRYFRELNAILATAPASLRYSPHNRNNGA